MKITEQIIKKALKAADRICVENWTNHAGGVNTRDVAPVIAAIFTELVKIERAKK